MKPPITGKNEMVSVAEKDLAKEAAEFRKKATAIVSDPKATEGVLFVLRCEKGKNGEVKNNLCAYSHVGLGNVTRFLEAIEAQKASLLLNGVRGLARMAEEIHSGMKKPAD